MHAPALARPWWLLPVGRLHPLWWVAIGAGLIAVDYVAGAEQQFPALYAVPVILAAWYSGRRSALALAVAVPLAHIVFHMTFWTAPDALPERIAATVFRGVVISLVALWFVRLAEHERELHRHVERLEGLLPICAFCKSIRNKQGDWESLEAFISGRSEAQFSHGLCPPCGKTHYPEFELAGSVRGRVEPKR